MNDEGGGRAVAGHRVGWWAFVLALGAVAAYIAHSLIGLLVLGVFGYYATRPICRRLAGVVDSDALAAGATVLLVLVPILFVGFYAGFQIVQQAGQFLGGTPASLPLPGGIDLDAIPADSRRAAESAIRNPGQFLSNPRETTRSVVELGLAALSALVGALLLASLAVTLSYFLLANDDALAEGLRRLFGGRDTAAYAYATAVDEDLESVFFGNLLFVLAMTLVAAATYWGTNLVAPEGLRVPMPFVLAFLTGVASLVPLVVGKVVYVPVVAYLGVRAYLLDGSQAVFVGGLLVVYFLLLDVLPQTFLQPVITGRTIDKMLLLFAYLLGPVLFGWYGFFLLPILFVLMLETVRIVLPELVHGEPLTPTASMGESAGADPEPPERSEPPDGADGAAEDGAEPDSE
ncbi:AI-2E family transporter [Halorarum salinum]|uniref:AI-2E family transporter n=1 Tax=Halorarum salinum TaxID=2743089 RepID=A0A7D5LDN0_9EURY|nr:AI-2E family transporter [Halobaculum salinum]QLG64190.1 AI-2E family transporter [Halobaculum salinum]